jgi:hypothetical protein
MKNFRNGAVTLTEVVVGRNNLKEIAALRNNSSNL